MDKDIIKKHLTQRFISEEKPAGLVNTEKIQKDEKNVNNEYYKEVEGKMKKYDNAAKQEDENVVEPKKFNYSDSQTEYHDEMEIRNGQEMLQYDGEVSPEFKDRNEMYIAGDSKTGNKTYTGTWNPETGEGNGNTESVWGASNDDFGKQLAAIIKKSAKKRDDAITPLAQMGDDIEVLPKGTKTVGDSRKIALEGIKRLNYKKEFNGLGNAISLIPESYKIDNKVFEMSDGNESYRIRWEGTLAEGQAIVLKSSNKTLVNEDINKMKHLMGFKSQDTLGRLDATERLNENSTFSQIWNKTKSILRESIEVHYSDGIRQMKKFNNPAQAIQFSKELINNNKAREISVFNAKSGFHSTAQEEYLLAWWGDGSYWDNVSKKQPELINKKIN